MSQQQTDDDGDVPMGGTQDGGGSVGGELGDAGVKTPPNQNNKKKHQRFFSNPQL
jgi:hypothetical protein